MAGDWIKMRGNLWDDPRIASLCDATDQPEAMIIGGLYWLWAMADQHTEDGTLPGLTLKAIDRKTGVPGLGAALADIDWLQVVDGGVMVPRFDEHNGASAKRRCQEAKRKASVRKVSASDADKKQTPCGAREREEKELNPHTPPADDSEPAGAENPDTPIALSLEWQPDQKALKAYAARAGIPLDAFTADAVSPFVLHHEPRGQVRTHREWTADLVRWVQRDRVNASRVVPLNRARASPGRQELNHEDTSWADGDGV